MKGKISLFLILAFCFACARNEHVKITGEIPGAGKQHTVCLKEVALNTPVLLDSTDVKPSGNFRLKVPLKQAGFMQLALSDSNYINLLAHPGDHIKLDFRSKNLAAGYEVKGSGDSELVRQLDARLRETKTSLDSIEKALKTLGNSAAEKAERKTLEERQEEVITAQRRYTIGFVLENMTSLASIKALYQRLNENMYVLYEPRDLQYLKIVSDSLQKYYPKSKHTKALLANVKRETSEFYLRQLNEATRELPETELDPVLPDTSGNEIALSSLRGDYVLLYFWSARSEECIRENLLLKQYYDKYHKKGFDIYAVNMDVNDDLWKSSIRYDELPWVNVREPDPSRPAYAGVYNVQSLPTNYLYGPDGEILGKNLFGRTLRIKLEQIFEMQ